ncbi:hypothetical protein [Epilithonimonas xixisoli]|uniref:Uncharacterized protein n=1 Tax=Epilithonimonas xixisoli TaxID=1476462 RepID=A0A4R8IB57_9FLAO|nr:hypothetical protein [Epilithonimonas xixisoli]TDX86800.1 hypothetical protein B0I22_0952 [Epilithonimonas xixisoli]
MKLRSFTFILIFICSIKVFSQDVKIKKDQILIDGTPAATIKNPYRDHYEYFNLAGEKLFTVDFKGLAQVSSAQPLQYLEVISGDGTQKATIQHEVLKASFSVQNIITHNLTVKYGVFTKNGVDKTALDKLFNNTSAEVNNVAAQEIQRAQERATKINSIKMSVAPAISGQDIIGTQNMSVRKVIGRIEFGQCSAFDTNNCIQVFDLDKNRIATVKNEKEGFKKYKVETYDDKTFYYNAAKSYLRGDPAFGEEFLAVLMAEGYMLGHQAKTLRGQILDAKIADAKVRSANIYNTDGYVIDKDGKKMTGSLTIYFQKLDIDRTGDVLPTDYADKFGQRLMVKYNNEKKQPRTKTINASSGAKFCIETENGETCYIGLGVKGEAMKKLTNINDLSFNNAYFYTLIYEDKGIQILQDPVEKEKFVVKIDKEDKGLMLDRSSDDTEANRLIDYLKTCKELADDIKKKNFNIKDVNDLIQIAKEYATCK